MGAVPEIMHLIFGVICLLAILSPRPTVANFYCHLCEGDRHGSCNFYRADPHVSGRDGEGALWHVYCSDKEEIEEKRKVSLSRSAVSEGGTRGTWLV
jgi:hypothetical protein